MVVTVADLDRVRAAFAAGVSLESSAVLLNARAGGHDWEAVTEAVAAGLAQRYGTPSSVEPEPPRLRRKRMAARLARFLASRRG